MPPPPLTVSRMRASASCRMCRPSGRARFQVRTVPFGAHFNLAIEFDRISLQRNAKRNQFVSVRAFPLRAGVLFVSAGMLDLSAVKTIFRSLRELLDRVLKHFLYDTH